MAMEGITVSRIETGITIVTIPSGVTITGKTRISILITMAGEVIIIGMIAEITMIISGPQSVIASSPV